MQKNGQLRGFCGQLYSLLANVMTNMVVVTCRYLYTVVIGLVMGEWHLRVFVVT